MDDEYLSNIGRVFTILEDDRAFDYAVEINEAFWYDDSRLSLTLDSNYIEGETLDKLSDIVEELEVSVDNGNISLFLLMVPHEDLE